VDFFHSQVERTPEARALIFPASTANTSSSFLSYRELNGKAEVWAQVLRNFGIGCYSLVGIKI